MKPYYRNYRNPTKIMGLVVTAGFLGKLSVPFKGLLSRDIDIDIGSDID